ncbi:MAG TPA: inositol monophosphatase family protein [Usitatibacter sp.]|nr:inositol monophosphatase family protein [Usitatibacter sp.]
MHPMLNTAVKAARKAGALITRASFDLDKLTVRSKRQKDYVSEVDHAAEEAIVGVLREAYPDHGILAEESGRHESESEYVWVIDPLDGTTNFLHGFPQYCVSIGLLHKGAPTQAVVLDPNRNELFTATKGVGAYLNDRRIRVSKTDRLESALVGTGFPFKEVGHLDDYMRMLRNMMLGASGVRRPGAAALDLAWVAAGRIDAFWEIGLSPWDMAAGALLVREAGGLIGDLDGNDGFLETGRVVAANAKLFSAVLQALAKR